MARTIIAAAALAFAALTPPAQADSRVITAPVERFFTLQPGGNSTPPARAFGGGPCSGAVATLGAQNVWWGRFAGGRATATGRHGNNIRSYQAEACFGSEGDCESWMFVLKGMYSDRPVYNECRYGYAPGAPVRPLWQIGRG